MQTHFYRVINLKIVPGVRFLGVVKVCLNELDPSGWWVEDVYTMEEGQKVEMPSEWARLVRKAIDWDKGICDEITQACELSR